MRFLALEAHTFGPLRDQCWELQADLFVVYGPNEAGKSSFHSALKTVLYGFERSSRSDHPLSQLGQGGENLELRAQVRLDSGEVLWVHRKLMSSAKLQVQDEQGRDLRPAQRNEALQEIQAITERLFDAVYSLTANDTNMQTDDVHEHIQELLLGETGLRGARPIAEVRRELANDRDQLWRPDGRGKPLVREFEQEWQEAGRLVRTLRSEDRELREARREREQLGPEIERLERTRRGVRQHLERLRYAAEWNRYRSGLQSVEAVRARLAALPESVRNESIEDPATLRASIERQRKALAPHRARLEAPAPSLSPEEQRWWDQADALRAWQAAWPTYRDLNKDWEHAQQEVARHTEELKQSLQRLGVGVPSAHELANVPSETLEGAIDSWEQEQSDHAERAQQREPSPLWMLMAALGLAAAVGLWQLPAYGPLWLAGLALCFGLGLWMLARPSRQPDLGPAPSMPRVWVECFDALGLDAQNYDSPPALYKWLQAVERYQGQHREARAAQRRVQHLEEQRSREAEPWRKLAQALDLDEDPMRGHAAAAARWEAVFETHRQTQHALEQRTESERLLQEQGAGLAHDQARLERMETWLRAAFPDRDSEGQALVALQEFRDQQAVIEAEGQRLRGHALYEAAWEQPGQPGLAVDTDEFAWLAEGEDLSAWQAADWEEALHDLEARLQAQHARLGSLEEKLRPKGGHTIAQAVERQRHARSEQERCLEERDRLALLGRILEHAEAQHRKQHQPDVLARAGHYLERITEGRYLALQYPPVDPDAEQAKPPLQVQSAQHGWCAVGRPLSRGTQEQIYLALRLGTLDYLDRGRESLPLVLDEALVHWDLERRRSLYQVLREIAERRQVILFTCHESFAREVEADLEARVIELQRR